MTVPRNPDPWLPGELKDPPPARRPGAVVRVHRYTPSPGGGSPPIYDELDNVQCLWIERRVGADPGLAAFQYDFGRRDPEAPSSVEQALSTASTLSKVVDADERLVVSTQRPDGSPVVLFDGFVRSFGMALAGSQERVDFHAVGVAVRLKDEIVRGGLWRHASAADDAEANVETDLPAVFNPKGLANASPEDADVYTEGFLHPAFIDPNIPGLGQRKWTLPMAARYLIYRHNADENYVRNPIGPDLDDLLVARTPKDGVPFDFDDPGSFDSKPIVVSDRPISGRDWPNLLRTMLAAYNFEMGYVLSLDADGNPLTTLKLWHRQAAPIKDVWLQPRGSSLDERLSNVGHAQLRRDLADVVTDWTVEGALKRFEASFILAPGFPMSSSDGANSASLQSYDKSHADWPTTNHDAYRLYLFDETGEGHYAVGTATKLTTATSLDDVLGEDQYVRRRRKPIGDLLTRDAGGQPLKARLSYSTDYAGPKPGIWDGTGTWRPIERGYELLKDRIGIYIEIDNPNSWAVGDDPATGAPSLLYGVESQCVVVSGRTFHLRLTVCIDGDDVVKGVASASGYSPLLDPVHRVLDARDRYRLDTVAAKSEFNDTDDPVVKRDDAEAADAEAAMNRAATEAGVLDGSVVIPYLTDYCQPGDVIRKINGRELGLRTDGGSDSTPVYPLVESVRQDFDGRQTTTLKLSDATATRAVLERRIRR